VPKRAAVVCWPLSQGNQKTIACAITLIFTGEDSARLVAVHLYRARSSRILILDNHRDSAVAPSRQEFDPGNRPNTMHGDKVLSPKPRASPSVPTNASHSPTIRFCGCARDRHCPCGRRVQPAKYGREGTGALAEQRRRGFHRLARSAKSARFVLVKLTLRSAADSLQVSYGDLICRKKRARIAATDRH
jgi:hypothetical protein